MSHLPKTPNCFFGMVKGCHSDRRGGQGFFVLIPTYIGDYRRRNKFRRHENYFVTHVTLTYQSTVCYYAARRDKLLPT